MWRQRKHKFFSNDYDDVADGLKYFKRGINQDYNEFLDFNVIEEVDSVSCANKYNKYGPTLADRVKKILEDDNQPYPDLEVINGYVRVFDEPNSNAHYEKIPIHTRFTVMDIIPSENSRALMAEVIGDYEKYGENHTFDGWVSLNSNNIILVE